MRSVCTINVSGLCQDPFNEVRNQLFYHNRFCFFEKRNSNFSVETCFAPMTEEQPVQSPAERFKEEQRQRTALAALKRQAEGSERQNVDTVVAGPPIAEPETRVVPDGAPVVEPERVMNADEVSVKS